MDKPDIDALTERLEREAETLSNPFLIAVGMDEEWRVKALTLLRDAASALALLSSEREEAKDVLSLRWPPGYAMPREGDMPSLIRAFFDDAAERMATIRDAEAREVLNVIGMDDHGSACERTMGATHPCTCGADALRARLSARKDTPDAS